MGNPPAMLQFTCDCRFEARNLTESMACQADTAPLESGRGSYEVRKWTLIPRFDNSMTQLPALKIADQQDLQNIAGLTLGSYEFGRGRCTTSSAP